MTIAGEGKCYLNGLFHRIPLKVVRGLEAVEMLQVTAEPKLKKLGAEHRDPLSLSPAERQRPHGLAQCGRDDRPASLNTKGMTPKSILPAKVGKRKIPAKAILKALIQNFFHPLLHAMKSLASSTGKSLREKYLVSRSKEMLAFRQVSSGRMISGRKTAEVKPKYFSKPRFDRGP